MGILSTQTFGLLIKNINNQIEANNKYIDSSKVEIDTLVEKAKVQIMAYFDSLYAMNLPINCYVECTFNNNDGEGEFYIVFIHERDRKLTYIEYDNTSKRVMISGTHKENNVDVDYADPESQYYDKRWSHGFKPEQNNDYSERICKSIMQCFEDIQNKMNMKILSNADSVHDKSQRDANFKKKVIAILKENIKDDDDDN